MHSFDLVPCFTHQDSAWQGDAESQSPPLNGHPDDDDDDDGDGTVDGDGAFDGDVHTCEEGDGDATSDDDDGVRPGDGAVVGISDTHMHPSS